MKNLSLILLLLFPAVLCAQSYKRNWQECFDNGRRNAPYIPMQASLTDSADNLYIAGFVNLPDNTIDDSIYLRKYNRKGDLLWEIYEFYKGTKAWLHEAPLAIASDKDGNIVLSYSYSFVLSNLDAVIAKYNSTGKKLWQTVFDGPVKVDNEQIKKLNIDGNGNIYLMVAETDNYDFNWGTISKFDSKGNLIWYRDLKGLAMDSLYKGYDVKDATIDSFGNAYVTGVTNTVRNGYRYQTLSYKFYANGDSAWRKLYVNNFSNNGYRIMYAEKDNSVVICGHTGDQNSTPDSIFAVKYKASGKQLWVYMGKPSGLNTYNQLQTFNQSVVDKDDNIIIASSQTVGDDYKAPFLTKLSSSGSLIWSKYAFKGISIPVPYIAFDLKG